ncbi:MAG TPA: protein phosphatase 2C domain-containing protein [Fimbriimonadaceae bacterium]|nr:protein phosphatase 2C domain-containing protein [Fimbriimonadaceae bacterium]
MDEITAEYSTDQIAPPAELRFWPRVTVACKTDLGRVRENNEDKFEYFMPEDAATLASRGQIFLVCDGMGGHAAGQIASELTAKTFIDVYLHHPAADPSVAMLAGVAAANRFVCDVGRAIPARRGMGTTLSGLILLQDRAYTVQVGDSRIYRLRQGELLLMTRDHTWIDEQIRAGVLTPEEAENHPYKHVLTRAVGTEGEVIPDVELHDLKPGDLFVLCSDGVMNHVTDERIGEIMSEGAPSEIAWKLVGEALVGGGSDNTTVMVVRLDELAEAR